MRAPEASIARWAQAARAEGRSLNGWLCQVANEALSKSMATAGKPAVRLEVVVRGVPGAGKTQLALALSDMLAGHGARVMIADDIGPGDSAARARHILSMIGPQLDVIIRTECTPKDAKSADKVA